MSYIFSPDASVSYQKAVVRDIPKHYKICRQVAKEAKRQKVDHILAVSIAFHETRFDFLTSSAGAKGPLGVIPKYHCPKSGKCDYIKAGILALKKITAIRKDTCSALALYNRGFKGKCSHGRSEYFYAQRVLRLYYELKLFNQKSCYSNIIK